MTIQNAKDSNFPSSKQPPLTGERRERVRPNGQGGEAAHDALLHALRYAREGVPVIWIPRGTKKPLAKGWPTLATCDPAIIQRWAAKHPGCNFGLVMGGEFIAIDVDEGGMENIPAAYTLPRSRTHSTPRKGAHILYLLPKGLVINNRVGVFAHVDVRSAGGQIVCPGSVHPNGGVYAMGTDVPIVPLPAVWIDLLTKPLPAAAPAKPNGKGLIPPGTQDVTLFKLAAAMQRRGASEAAKLAAMREEIKRFEQRPGAPWTEEDLRRIARSAGKYPPHADEPQSPPAETAKACADEEAVQHSDDALALLFSERHEDLRYTAAWGKWSVWDGKVWREDTTLAIFDRVRKVNREVSGACPERSRPARLSSAQTVAAVERLARSDRRHAATIDQWDADLWCLNTPEGVVDLRTGNLRPARREDYQTKMTGAAPSGDCPRWLAFLDHIMKGDEELIQYLQRMCGYTLVGSTREQALFFLYGTGGNGKGVFLNTVMGVMGDYAKTSPIETFIASRQEHHPTDLAGLQGARLVTAVETEDGRRWAESKIKTLTGGDRIAARFMRQDFFEFTPQFKLIIAGNHKPGLRTVDEATRRRFNLIPFTVTIPEAERDKDLEAKLKTEWRGILRWMVEGCLAWQAQGLKPPKAVSEATARYLASEDTPARWMEERCVLGKTLWTSSTALYIDWCNWCESNHEHCGSQRSFSEKLETRGGTPEHQRTGNGFRGIGLKNLGV